MSMWMLALALAAGSAAAGIGRRFTERARARRQLRMRAVLGPGAAEGEHVRVSGVVRVYERSVTAPLSGRACVAYRARAKIMMMNVKRRMPKASVSPPESSLAVPFLLDRGAEGMVVVDGPHALFDVPSIKLGAADGERGRAFLAVHGFTSAQNVTARFDEVAIEPGMSVTVAGVLMKDVALEPSADASGFRQGPPPSIRIVGSLEHPLVIGLAKAPRALAPPPP